MRAFLRYGFNSAGHAVVLERIKDARSNPSIAPVGVNLGKNKTSDDPEGDYTKGVQLFGAVADYLVINISRYVTTSILRSLN